MDSSQITISLHLDSLGFCVLSTACSGKSSCAGTGEMASNCCYRFAPQNQSVADVKSCLHRYLPNIISVLFFKTMSRREARKSRPSGKTLL